VCWLSSDDLFDARKLEIHREWIRRHPGCQFFHSHFHYLEDTTGAVTDPAPWREIPGEEWHLLDMLAGTSIHGNSICVARGALQEAGGFDARFRNAQDYDMWLRLLSRHPAVYIPERTCVTRMHTGQGTQTFARAGYYDSARAGIDFLNTHSLPALFPLLDLREPAVAEEAIAKTLDVASRPEAFVYALGEHPLLLLRALEWIDLHAEGARNHDLRQLVLRHCDQMRKRGGALGFYGKALSAALCRSGLAFTYQPLSADAIASQRLSALSRAGDPEAAQLRRYLGRTGDVVQKRFTVDLSEDIQEVVYVCQRGLRLPVPVAYGAHHAMVEVATYAQRAGCRVLVTALSDAAFGFVDGLPHIGARDERALARVLRALREMDAVVTVSRADALKAAAARRKVIYQHDPCVPYGADPVRDLNRARVQVACVSEFSRAQLAGSGFRRELLQVVRNGYDRDAFRPDNTVARVPHSLVLAGTVVHYKGTDVALEALRLIRRRFPDATLSVYGDNLPWYEIPEDFESRGLMDRRHRLRWKAVEVAYPGARYYGAVSHLELAAAFRAHDVLVMPSQFGETFGLVSLEAQACGCLPVLPDQGGFPETMVAEGTGFLYGPNTAEALAVRVIGLWESDRPAQAQRAEAQAWVAEHFSWERAGARLLSVVDQASVNPRFRRRRHLSRAALIARSGELFDLAEIRRSEGSIGLWYVYLAAAAAIWPLSSRALVRMAVMSVPGPLRRRLKRLLGLPTRER